MENLVKQVKFLKIYAGFLTFCVIALAIFVLVFMHKSNFKEITAERLNIIETDGRVRMVISNQEKQSPGMVNGRVISERERPAGMIFFNNDGDECGGLVYDGDKKSASMTYSIDQYKNDQVMQLQYSQDNGSKGETLDRSYGLKLWDRPDDFTLAQMVAYSDSLKKLKDSNIYNTSINKLRADGKLGRERFFAGKDEKGEVGLFLRDSKGIPRLKIYIDNNDQPVIEKLDEKGVIQASK